MENGNFESIYDLIPREYAAPPKEKRYRSKYPPDGPPTYSTFGLGTTSKICGNVCGEYEHFNGPHRHKSARGTFGGVKGTAKASTNSFRKKNTGTPKLAVPSKFNYKTERKPPVPRVNEKPILGLKSGKNFITANAVEVILAAPKVNVEKKRYADKENYGTVPKYLNNVK